MDEPLLQSQSFLFGLKWFVKKTVKPLPEVRVGSIAATAALEQPNTGQASRQLVGLHASAFLGSLGPYRFWRDILAVDGRSCMALPQFW
jgi:hypothetical protein